MKRTKETEKEIAAAIVEFLSGIAGLFEPRPILRDYQEKMMEEVFAQYCTVLKLKRPRPDRSAEKMARHVRRASGDTAVYRQAFGFEDFQERMVARIAGHFEVPPEILKMRFRPAGFESLDPRRPGYSGVTGVMASQTVVGAYLPAFFRAKKDDKVFDVRHGWGKIVALPDSPRTGQPLHIEVNFPDDIRRHYYLTDGRIKAEDANPSLYWDEVVILPPAKPAPKTVTKYKIRFKLRIGDPCLRSVDHYKSVEDFKKRQHAIKVLCACILMETAEEFPA